MLYTKLKDFEKEFLFSRVSQILDTNTTSGPVLNIPSGLLDSS